MVFFGTNVGAAVQVQEGEGDNFSELCEQAGCYLPEPYYESQGELSGYRSAGYPSVYHPSSVYQTGKYQSSRNQRTRSYESEDNERSACQWCECALIITIATILLIGVSALTIFWAVYYEKGYDWQGGEPEKQFNLHPTLMVAGFITFSGFSTLLYRICRCLRRIYVKLLHAIFHALALPCIVIGFLAIFDYHNTKNWPHFYSLHSWIGLVAMGLFGIQYVVGFFSFLLLLICSKGTANFRASLVPVHAAFGILTFVLGVAACLTGLTQKVLMAPNGGLEDPKTVQYSDLPPKAIVINAIGITIVGVAVLVMYTVRGTGGYRLRKVAAQHPS